MRSVLTALTAAVAVATVFATRGLLRGSEVALETDLSRLGVRTVQVVDGSGFLERGSAKESEPLGPGDVAAARAALAADGVRAEVLESRVRLGTARAAAGGKAIPLPLVETGPAYARTFDAEMAAGRFLEEADLASAAPPVCVLDADTAHALGGVAVGADVVLRDGSGERTARVVGILADPFRMRLTTYAPDLTSSARRAVHQILAFRNVYLPPRGGAPGGAMLLYAVAAKREEASKVHDALDRALRAKERGLVVWSRGTWVRTVVETAHEQIEIANIIWAVVLGVALVMIATVTLVGVRERTAEVAVRRSQGATRLQVVGQLLAEGALLAAAGGLAGIPLGLLAADRLATLLTWRPWHSINEGLLAVALGVLVGLLAAALPAWRASRWDVVEGLRHGA
jgi:macrolide transport system ATP-binding/permease protein